MSGHVEKPSAATMWCKKCGYVLDGLSEPRCPECASPFNPTRRGTFLRKPPRSRWSKIVLRSGAVVSVLLLSQFLLLYWRPMVEWRARAELRRNPNLTFIELPWTPTVYHAWWAEWAERHKFPIPMAIRAIFARETSTDSDMITIRRFRNLRALHLSGRRITNAGLTDVAALKRLKILSLSQTMITDDGLAGIKGLKSLTYLDLSRTGVTDVGLAYIQALQGLETLRLIGLSITDNGLANLRTLVNLEHLDLNRTSMTDAGLKHVKALQRLRSLDLSHTNVTDDGMLRIDTLIDLEKLSLDGNSITDRGLVHIDRLENLERLDVVNTAVTKNGVSTLIRKDEIRVSIFPIRWEDGICIPELIKLQERQ